MPEELKYPLGPLCLYVVGTQEYRLSKCRDIYCMKVLSVFLCINPVLCNKPSRFVYLLQINAVQVQVNSGSFFSSPPYPPERTAV